MTCAAPVPQDLDALAAEYRRLLPLMAGLHNRIARLAGPERIKSCARRLGMLGRRNGRRGIVFAHELEMAVFEDYLLYMHRPHGISLVEQMVNRRAFPEGSDEQRLLACMAQARFSLFWIRELVEAGGFAALDIIGGGEVFILDQTLPRQTEAKGMLSAFRIFPLSSAWMHTGVNLSFGRIEDSRGLEPLGRVLTAREEQELNEENIARWRARLHESL